MQRYTATEGVAHEVWFVQLEVIDQCRDVAGHEPDVDRAIDVSRTTMSLQVDSDDLVALREQWKNGPERLTRHKPTVQQDERAPSAVSLVVELDAVDLSVLAGALHCGGRIGFHGGAPSVFDGNECRR